MDMNKAIRMAVDTGEVKFGARDTIKDASSGKAKLIIISANCPKQTREAVDRNAKMSSVPVLVYDGSSIELGSLCGKPFPVSALSVIDAGNSNIMDAANKQHA